MKLRFEKWQGLGNDFVLLFEPPRPLSTEEVRRLCDRRFGIGADGVLTVGTNPASMVVQNADGSRPEMCGNGLRCVAAALAERRPDSRFVVMTDAGERACEVTLLAPGRAEVTIAMGIARALDDLVVGIDGRTHRFTRIDVGNPHAITFEPYSQAEVDQIGPRVATTPEAGTNVEFCTAAHDGGRIDVVVWERGVGRTLACGTGACAVAAAACAAGRAPYATPIAVGLPGGDLSIVVPRNEPIRMRGPATRVFVGEIVIDRDEAT
jgi:diaminopimelate epimerase